MSFDPTVSVLNPGEQTRVIRSHRAPKDAAMKRKVLALAVIFAASLVAPTPPLEVESSPAVAAAITTVELSATTRESTVSRSVSLSRKQRIEKVISFALAQRGDRYRWGATGPSRWDCSGLVMKAFAKGGKRLPHYTGGMQKKGTKVSKRNLKRGDIIFPQRGHVGIYLGGGMMVHASSGKGKVVKAKAYGFYTARRII